MTPKAPFSLNAQPNDGTTVVVEVAGEIDIASSSEFEDGLTDVIRGRDTHALVVDLSDVTFMDSNGLSALVRVLERQQRAGGALAVVTRDERIKTLFEISRLDRLLRLYPTRAEAVAAMAVHASVSANSR